MKTEISNVSVEEKAVEKKLTRNITLPLIEDDESIRSASNSTDSENEETLSELKQQSKLSISFNMNVADSELESIVECAKYVSSKSMEEIVINIFPKLNKEIISIKNEVDRLFSFVKYINGKGAKILMEKVINEAKEKGLKIIPVCSYAVSYFEKNPEYKELLK